MNYCNVVVFSLLIFLFGLVPVAESADDLARGLVLSQGCTGCHVLNSRGGTLGSDLEQVGKHLTPRDIRQKLLYPDAKLSTSRMPDYRHLSVAEIDALVQYLSGLK